VILQDGIQAHVQGRRKHLLLHHGDERAVRDAADAGGAREGILKGHVQIPRGFEQKGEIAGAAFWQRRNSERNARAQEILEQKFGVAADVWSVTSYKALYIDGIETERWNRLHPTEKAHVPYVTQCIGDAPGVIVAATDYLKTLPKT